MSLKVAIIAENFFPHVGGVEKFLLDLAKGLIERGVEVRVVTSDSGGINGFYQFEAWQKILCKRYSTKSRMALRKQSGIWRTSPS